MKAKEVLGGICLMAFFTLVGWVPESDLPKQEKEPNLKWSAEAVTIIANKVSRQLEEIKIATAEPVEEVVEEEIEEVVEEEPEIIEEVVEEPIEETYEEEYYEEETYEEETYDEWGNNLVYLGAYDITAYEWTGYPCANGNYPTVGYTVACNSLPLGTVLYIDGIGYRTVEDRGATWHSDWWIDLYLGDVDECFQWGIRTRDVWIVQ